MRRSQSVNVQIALLAISFCTAVLPAAHAVTTISGADNPSSDVFASYSGWKLNGSFKTGAPPTGIFAETYKNWVDDPEPVAWAGVASIAKPNAANWSGLYDGPRNNLTTFPSGSYSRNSWSVALASPNFTVLGAPATFYTVLGTASIANAAGGSGETAHARTRLMDPWTLNSPQTDPNWNSSVEGALDPSGKWSLAGQLSMFGSDTTNGASFGSSAYGEWSYAVAFNSQSMSSATTVVDVKISDSATTVTIDPGLWGSGMLALADLNGNQIDPDLTVDQAEAAVAAMVDAFRTSSGWVDTPSGFDATSFDPSDFSEASQVFTLDMSLFLDNSTTSATVFTSQEADATAVPEPSTFCLMLVAAIGIAAPAICRSLKGRSLRKNPAPAPNLLQHLKRQH